MRRAQSLAFCLAARPMHGEQGNGIARRVGGKAQVAAAGRRDGFAEDAALT